MKKILYLFILITLSISTTISAINNGGQKQSIKMERIKRVFTIKRRMIFIQNGLQMIYTSTKIMRIQFINKL